MSLTLGRRISAARRAALIHLGMSSVVAALAALLVLRLWYPHPYDVLSGGRSLLLLLTAVAIVCGPVLTLVLFNPDKPKIKWRTDLALIVLLQAGTLIYGLDRVVCARPVFLAFEGSRFRVVRASDIDSSQLHQAPPELAALGFGGPRLIGTRLISPTDPEFPHSVQFAMQGLHPAFRPIRWVPYSQQQTQVLAALTPLSKLRQKHPAKADGIDRMIAESHLSEAQLGYLPLVQEQTTDWVVIVRLNDVMPIAYLHADGWAE